MGSAYVLHEVDSVVLVVVVAVVVKAVDSCSEAACDVEFMRRKLRDLEIKFSALLGLELASVGRIQSEHTTGSAGSCPTLWLES